MEIRENFRKSVLSFHCGFQESNTGRQACSVSTLPDDPCHHQLKRTEMIVYSLAWTEASMNKVAMARLLHICEAQLCAEGSQLTQKCRTSRCPWPQTWLYSWMNTGTPCPLPSGSGKDTRELFGLEKEGVPPASVCHLLSCFTLGSHYR